MNEFEKKLRQTLDEKDIFLSNKYRQHFQNLADMVTQRFDERIDVKILWSNPAQTAYTNNSSVVINANCDLMQTREERFVGCTGFLAHELGHILYTDFMVRNDIIEKISNGIVPTEIISELPNDNITDAILYSIKTHPTSFASIFAHIENCLEDRYIENEISKFYEGTFKVSINFLNAKIIRDSESAELNLMNCVLMQVRDSLPDKAVKKYPLLLQAKCCIDKINGTHNYVERIQNASRYIYCIWEYITKLLKDEYNAQKDKAVQGSSNLGNRQKSPMSDYTNSSSDSSNDGEKSDDNIQSALADASEKMDNIISGIAKEMQANDKLVKQIEDEFDEKFYAASACSGIDIGSKYVVKTLSKGRSNVDMNEICRIARDLEQRIKRSVIRRENGRKRTGLSVGRRIDVKAYARGDSKMFTKTTYPNKKPILSVCVALDGSGSMNGERLVAAKKALLVLNEFCRNTNVPLSAFGFQGSSEENEITKFFDFTDTKDKTAYRRIFSYRSGGANRDGFAIKFAHQKLKVRREINRLLIIISDGRPSAYASHEDGITDIKQSLKQLRRERITPMALAIGEDMDKLKSIYGNTLVDARDLSILPIKLVEYLQRYLV